MHSSSSVLSDPHALAPVEILRNEIMRTSGQFQGALLKCKKGRADINGDVNQCKVSSCKIT